MKARQNPYLTLVKLRFSARQENFFWDEAAEWLVRVDSFRAQSRRCIFYDPVSGKELSTKKFLEIQREGNRILRQLDFEAARQFPLSKFLEACMFTKVVDDSDDPTTYFAGIPNERIVEYRTVIRSRDDAMSALVVGDKRQDAKKFVLWEVGRLKTFNDFALKDIIVRVIHQAAQDNDMRFFKRLADAFESKKPCPALGWRNPVNLNQFLVSYWCYGLRPRELDPKFPPLCFFEGKARAEFCSLVFGVNNDGHYNDSIRQAVKKLGLVRSKQPKIKKVIIEGDKICFV
jgi:hypothetical protein